MSDVLNNTERHINRVVPQNDAVRSPSAPVSRLSALLEAVALYCGNHSAGYVAPTRH